MFQSDSDSENPKKPSIHEDEFLFNLPPKSDNINDSFDLKPKTIVTNKGVFNPNPLKITSNLYSNPKPLEILCDSPIFSINEQSQSRKNQQKKSETINSPGFGRSKSEIFPKSNLALKLNNFEAELDKRLEDAKLKLNEGNKNEFIIQQKDKKTKVNIENIEKLQENFRTIPDEYSETYNDFTLLLSWMKSIDLNFRLRKNPHIKETQKMKEFYNKINKKFKSLKVLMKSKSNFVKTTKNEIANNQKKCDFDIIGNNLLEEIHKNLEECNKKIHLLQDLEIKLESFKKISPNYHPRKFNNNSIEIHENIDKEYFSNNIKKVQKNIEEQINMLYDKLNYGGNKGYYYYNSEDEISSCSENEENEDSKLEAKLKLRLIVESMNPMKELESFAYNNLKIKKINKEKKEKPQGVFSLLELDKCLN